jgi:hypothetical protein
MRAREFVIEANSVAQAWIDRVYDQFPKWNYGRGDRVMVWGEGEDQQFAVFALKPSMSRPNAVEVDWFQAYPLRSGVGTRAMQELQRLAQADGITLTLYPWDKGQVSQRTLTGFYKKQGFQPQARGARHMAWEPVQEGGWDTKLTQNTVLHPRIVAPTLQVVDRFVQDFNVWLKTKGLGPVSRGRPTGSSAYHAQDTESDPDKIYGDIDLQMIGPETEGQSQGQFTAYWNALADQFVKEGHAPYVDTTESKAGHPIFQIGNHDFVQVDLMWHPERLEKWGAARVTPERGVKGLLFGNMFSVLGELLDMSIQHAGVQLKVVDGQHVPFSKQKDTTTVTVTTNPETFILDIFNYEAKQLGVKRPKIDTALKQFPGNDVEDVKIFKLVNGIKGFARSCELNNMFGQGNLAKFNSASDFIKDFWRRYEEKAMMDISNKKRDKAATPQARARAESDRQKVKQGVETVKGYFA